MAGSVFLKIERNCFNLPVAPCEGNWNTRIGLKNGLGQVYFTIRVCTTEGFFFEHVFNNLQNCNKKRKEKL